MTAVGGLKPGGEGTSSAHSAAERTETARWISPGVDGVGQVCVEPAPPEPCAQVRPACHAAGTATERGSRGWTGDVGDVLCGRAGGIEPKEAVKAAHEGARVAAETGVHGPSHAGHRGSSYDGIGGVATALQQPKPGPGGVRELPVTTMPLAATASGRRTASQKRQAPAADRHGTAVLSFDRSDGGHAAVGCPHGARDIGRPVGGKKGDHLGDLLG
jgi:hypothetical protein